jgi:hypothetical protein
MSLTIVENNDATRAAFYAYAWPGGYEVAYLDDEGNMLCADCAHDEYVNDGTNFHPINLADSDNEMGEMCEGCNQWIREPEEG